MSRNSNSYICVALQNSVKDLLYNYASDVSKYNPTFKVMDKEDLHMTFIFLGSNKKYKEIQNINNIVITHNTNINTFCFKSICPELFPPTKQNLLIVKFQSSDTVNLIRKQLVTQLGVQDTEFIPHITLGKFVGKVEKRNLPDFTSINFMSDSLILHNPYF